ncbi:MAG TPA: methyltransferase domain-containing protein [Blastocatellia bacterium]|nr:methyltransferase domain-containing protein [Blastocatellia bacterium]
MRPRSLTQSLTLFSLAFLPLSGRVRTLYRALADHNSLCREKLYQNLGYWKDNPPDLDAAAEAMADLLAVTARLSQNDRVLDAGFGYADQDIFWAEKYRPAVIYGVNISREQLERARARIAACGLAATVRLEEGDASRLRFPDASFDVVFALESAFHFKTREDFFCEAYRVLRPGGRLALTDLAATTQPLAFRDRLAEVIGRSFWQIPKENLYPIDVYRQKLESCGFRPVTVTSIWVDVYPRFVEFARARLEDHDLAERMNPVLRRMLMGSMKARRRLSQQAMDYLLALAIKPSHE